MGGRVQGWAWVASTDVDQRYPEADTRQEAVEACIAGALLNDSQTTVTNDTQDYTRGIWAICGGAYIAD